MVSLRDLHCETQIRVARHASRIAPRISPRLLHLSLKRRQASYGRFDVQWHTLGHATQRTARFAAHEQPRVLL